MLKAVKKILKVVAILLAITFAYDFFKGLIIGDYEMLSKALLSGLDLITLILAAFGVYYLYHKYRGKIAIQK